MEYIKAQIGRFGGILALFGVASSVLSIFGYNLKLLMWVDLWGNTMGWLLRIGFIVAGVALLFIFGKSEDEEEETKTVSN
ncbi:hypothetical protein [Microscilla marina]|uniref:Uncharacterized protein n=1 Tax=Microscilla marina ATCC 23134 TaxID=313606 RepID=A1ZFQ5_MICM2|nr:hypothetical protein [Microscilla marina]EAY30829.1 hypothetical protein M23134_01153 [Microscilla marina ATCC 23134]